jgi:hypothetical protein
MNAKQQDLLDQLKSIIQELDMQCIHDESFDDLVQSMDIFSRNLNDIVEDMAQYN